MNDTKTYKTETRVSRGGKVTLSDLPFEPGDTVEVTVSRKREKAFDNARYPLRGQPIRYTDPYSSVAEDDWEALK